MMDERQTFTARRTRKRWKEVILRLPTRTYVILVCLQNASRHNYTKLTTLVRHTEARCVTMVLLLKRGITFPFIVFDIDVAVNNTEVFSVATEMQY